MATTTYNIPEAIKAQDWYCKTKILLVKINNIIGFNSSNEKLNMDYIDNQD